jgi:hypothetical protein
MRLREAALHGTEADALIQRIRQGLLRTQSAQ